MPQIKIGADTSLGQVLLDNAALDQETATNHFTQNFRATSNDRLPFTL